MVETRTIDTQGSDESPRQLVRYQFGNHLGSASLELNREAKIISYEEYYPYGSTSYQAIWDREVPKQYRYMGKERDEESGFYYYGARYYLPWLGRWSSTDPAGLSGGSNLYGYVRNNPISWIDATGNIPVSAAEPPKRTVRFLRSLRADPPKADERNALLGKFRPAAADQDAAQFYSEMVEHSEDYWQVRILGHINRSQDEGSLQLIERQLTRMHVLTGSERIPVIAGLTIGLREAGRSIYGEQPTYPALPAAEAAMLRRSYRGIADTYAGAGSDYFYTRQHRAKEEGFLPHLFQQGLYHGQVNPETGKTIASVKVPHDEVFMAYSSDAAWALMRFRERAIEAHYLEAEINALSPLARNFFIAATFATPGGKKWSDYQGGRWGIVTLLTYMEEHHLRLNEVTRILEFGSGGIYFRDQAPATRAHIRAATLMTQFEHRYDETARFGQVAPLSSQEQAEFNQLIHQLAQ